MATLLKYAEASAVALLAIFAPIQATLLTVLALVAADLCFAVAVAVKVRRPVTSRGLRRTVVKLACYEVVIALVFLAETYLGLPFPAVKFIAGLIAVTELKSLLEHCSTLTGGAFFRAVVERLAPSDKKEP